MVFEYNASDSRKISDLIHMMKETTSKLCINHKNINKLLILEEADGLTDATQILLKKYLSVNTHKTSFILTCNNIHEIKKKVCSGFNMIKFKKLTIEDLVVYFIKILEKEKINYELEILYKIAYHSNGDMRIGLNYLESISNVCNEINEKYFYKILDFRNPLIDLKFFEACLRNDFSDVINILDVILEEGYSFEQIKKFFAETLRRINCYKSKISEILMEKLLREIQVDKGIMITNDCQVYGFFAKICSLIQQYQIKLPKSLIN